MNLFFLGVLRLNKIDGTFLTSQIDQRELEAPLNFLKNLNFRFLVTIKLMFKNHF